MGAIMFPAVVAVIVFIAFLLLLQRRILSDEDRRKQSMLGELSEGVQRHMRQEAHVSILKDQKLLMTSGLTGAFFKVPGVMSTYDLLLKAGLGQKIPAFLIGSLVLFLVIVVVLHTFGFWGFVAALAGTFILSRKYLKRRISKRNDQFISLFPDAVDMIVRSIRSGHPLNTAMRMIAENMEDPVRYEFKLVVDEVSYGRSLPEALARMARRVDEPDLHFFVVVLSVQQETGGSLAEVLTNLSGVIRKRRQLRLKIRALTSEGRATSYILGALPVLEFGVLYWLTPKYLEPLFTTSGGNLILAAAGALILFAMWIVRSMIEIEI